MNSSIVIGGFNKLTEDIRYEDLDEKENKKIIEEFENLDIIKDVPKDTKVWQGYRPITYTFEPLVFKKGNIIVNTGYGHNGFVYCWSSAEKVINLIKDHKV